MADSFTFTDFQYLLDDVGSLASKRGVAPNMAALFELSDVEAIKQLRRRNEFVNRRKDVAAQLAGRAGSGALANPAFQAGVDAHKAHTTKQAVQQAFFVAVNLLGLFVLYKLNAKT